MRNRHGVAAFRVIDFKSLLVFTDDVLFQCYLFVLTEPPTALIKGGGSREVSYNESFTIDAGISKDSIKSSTASLIYFWQCVSKLDPKICEKFVSTSKKRLFRLLNSLSNI